MWPSFTCQSNSAGPDSAGPDSAGRPVVAWLCGVGSQFADRFVEAVFGVWS
jgi:hypothetical protein